MSKADDYFLFALTIYLPIIFLIFDQIRSISHCSGRQHSINIPRPKDIPVNAATSKCWSFCGNSFFVVVFKLTELEITTKKTVCVVQNVLVNLFNHPGSSLSGCSKTVFSVLGWGLIKTHSEQSTKARSDWVSEVCPEHSSKQKQALLSWILHSEYYIVGGIVQCVAELCADRYCSVDKDPLILKENFTPHWRHEVINCSIPYPDKLRRVWPYTSQ